MVEVALLISLLLTVVFGIVECGRLMFAYTTLSDAARLGTRYAAVHGGYRTGSGIDGPSGPGNTGNIETKVKGLTTAAGLPAESVSVQVDYPDGTNDVGKKVSVTVLYSFNAIISLIPLTAVNLGSTSQATICY